MKLLAIETSCDETAIAIIEVKNEGTKTKFKVLGNDVLSQIALHTQYGGVFPAMAKREHIKNLPIIFEKVLKESKTKIEKTRPVRSRGGSQRASTSNGIDAIAVTTGPGLEPALWTGIVFARELHEKYKIPVVPVNHMEGHIFSIYPKKGKTFTIDSSKVIFPALSLLVSGGHTELILVKSWPARHASQGIAGGMKYKNIGKTRDDASGEAFDKVARMLELPYPGGPEISRLAEIERKERENSVLGGLGSTTARARGIFQQKNIRASQNTISSDNENIILPRPMIYSKDYDFSFSGLKTAVLYMIRDLKEKNPKVLEDISIKQKIAKEFEDAVVEVLTYKTIKAIKEYKIKTLIVGGGVSANKYLQETMMKKIKENKLKTKVHFPSKSLTGDNALMIAIAGYFQYKNKKSRLPLKANGNLQL